MDPTQTEKPLLRDYLNSLVFIATIGLLFALNLIVKPPAILVSERRPPAVLPPITVRSIRSGSFMKGFEAYAADHFVFREAFRSVRAATVFGPFLQSDKNGLYFGDAGIGEFKPVDPLAARQTAEKIKKVADTAPDCRVFYSLVPDKSIYAGKYLPGLDLEAVEALLADVLADFTYISLSDCLDADSFYPSDLHWDQARIAGVVDRLGEAMGVTHDLRAFRPMLAGAFHGVYAGQIALPVAWDQMIYEELPGLQARRLNDSTLLYEACPVYDLERFAGPDPYDLFLQGPQAIVELLNPSVSGGELYLFRDSYGSSLAPLLAGAYSKVTLIDLRYIDLRVLDQFLTIRPGSDLLFLYSSQILNNPSVLRV